jgi:release factor glutamine methyltransferase
VQLKDALTSAVDRLAAAEVPSPRLNAELLLMFTIGCDRSYLYAHPERELSDDEQRRYEQALSQRARGIPAQYITGHQEFWGMDFIVSPAVLIPRPETEHVIETVLELQKSDLGLRTAALKTNPVGSEVQGPRSDVRSLRIVDIGTGSGCIALAVAKELPSAEIHATDTSPEALEVARANTARYQMEARIQFHQTDLLTGLEPSTFDFVVSNPPYVGECEADLVQLEVRKFEPRRAVFAGPTGLEVIERLIPAARDVLKPGGWLVMEISGTIADGVKLLLESWDCIEIKNDLQGIPRVALAKKRA